MSLETSLVVFGCYLHEGIFEGTFFEGCTKLKFSSDPEQLKNHLWLRKQWAIWACCNIKVTVCGGSLFSTPRRTQNEISKTWCGTGHQSSFVPCGVFFFLLLWRLHWNQIPQAFLNRLRTSNTTPDACKRSNTQPFLKRPTGEPYWPVENNFAHNSLKSPLLPLSVNWSPLAPAVHSALLEAPHHSDACVWSLPHTRLKSQTL